MCNFEHYILTVFIFINKCNVFTKLTKYLFQLEPEREKTVLLEHGKSHGEAELYCLKLPHIFLYLRKVSDFNV